MRDPQLVTRRAAASAIGAVTLLESSPAAHAAFDQNSPDAALVALGREWEAIQLQFEARQAELETMSDAAFALKRPAMNAEGDRLFERQCAVFDKIVNTPARSSIGLAVKARILAHEGRDLAAISAALRRVRSAPERAALSLANDIITLAEASNA